MSRKWSFESAVEFVQVWSGRDTDAAGVSDAYYEAEEFILDYKPVSADQVLQVIDVVKANLDSGSRSDGKDINALNSVADWVRQRIPAIPLAV